MREAAADRPPRAHRAIGDALRHLGEKAVRRVGDALVLDRRVRDAGAENDGAAVLLDTRELGDARHIDDEGRLHEAKIEHRPERLPTRQNLGVRISRKEPHRLGERARPFVVEGDRLHCARFAGRARPIASTMRRGVTGKSRSSQPRPLSASLMALVIAAGGAMAPPSPMPFCPKRV